MKRNRLKYAGRGQIVREADGRLVSPRDVVTWFNDLCDVADEMHKTLTFVLDAMTYAAQKKDLKSPAGGVQSQVPRNGEAEAVANAVGRESVAQGRTRSNTSKQSSARPAPTAPTGTELRRESGTPNAKVTWTEDGPSNCTRRKPGAAAREAGQVFDTTNRKENDERETETDRDGGRAEAGGREALPSRD